MPGMKHDISKTGDLKSMMDKSTHNYSYGGSVGIMDASFDDGYFHMTDTSKSKMSNADLDYDNGKLEAAKSKGNKKMSKY